MTTSLASSPVLPIVMAGVAGLLVFGTLSSTATGSPDSAADSGIPAPEPVPAVEVPALTGNTVPATCAGKVCTITFPKVGDSAQAFGKTVQATAFYQDGLAVLIGKKTKIVSSLTVFNKAGGYTVEVTKIDPAAGQTVKITKK